MIHLHTRTLFEKNVETEDYVIEFGDNLVNYCFDGQEHIRQRTLDYYGGKIRKFISIDNRKDADRALPLDLSKAIPKKELDKIKGADVVTDLGTLEHVKNLRFGLKNAFDLCKVGGKMIHSNPKTGNFPGHGFHYYTEAFWWDYAEAAGLEVLEVGEHPAENNTKNGWEVYAVLKKAETSKFPSKKVFDEIYEKNIKKK